MSIPIRWQLQKKICDAYEVKGHTASALHGHYHFLLTLITRGEGVQSLNGREVPFSVGTLFLLSPTDFHKNRATVKGGFDYFGVKFSHSLLEGRLSEISVLDKLPLVIRLEGEEYETALGIFKRLVDESGRGEGRLGNEIYLTLLIEELIIIALRGAPACERTNPSEFINKALGYLYSHYSEDISVADAAAFMGYTPNYFNTKFKGHFGAPFAEHLRNMRLSYAANLLASTDLSVTEIAMESGFGCPEHFSRAFAKAYGKSPSAYRTSGGKAEKSQI